MKPRSESDGARLVTLVDHASHDVGGGHVEQETNSTKVDRQHASTAVVGQAGRTQKGAIAAQGDNESIGITGRLSVVVKREELARHAPGGEGRDGVVRQRLSVGTRTEGGK